MPSCDSCGAPVTDVVVDGERVPVDATVRKTLQGIAMQPTVIDDGTLEWTGKTDRRRGSPLEEAEHLRVCRPFDPNQTTMFADNTPRKHRYMRHTDSCVTQNSRGRWRPTEQQRQLGLSKIDQLRGQLQLDDAHQPKGN